MTVRADMWRRGAILLAVACLASCGRRETAQPALEAGLARLRAGLAADGTEADLRAAAAQLETAVRRKADNATAAANLGIAYWKLNRYEDAARLLRRAAELNPADARPLEFVAKVYIDAQQWEKARLALDQAFQRTTDSPRILTAMSVAAAQAGADALAQEFLVSALEQDAAYPPALYNMAVLQRDRLGNPAEAAGYFRRYLSAAESPGAAAVDTLHVALARDAVNALAKQGRRPEAAAATLPEPKPDRAKGKRLLAEAEEDVRGGAFDSALVRLKEARAILPDDPDVIWALALLYDRHIGDQERAAALYEAFLKQFPDDPRLEAARRREAESLKRARSAAAEAALTAEAAGTGTAGQPDTGRALDLWSRGLQYQNAGETEKAVAAYTQAIAYDETLLSAWYNLGLVQKQAGRLRKAAQAFEQVLGLKPDMAEAEYMLGVVYYDLREPDEAVAHLERALRMKPDHGRAHLVLGAAYGLLGRKDKARVHLERTLVLLPGTSYAQQARALLEP
ncbi:MAG: tetratricopeptide repeat protein [Lentisphaerae bacterium]|nr:tetratricopeptide repeat protein [Lentisphaerota bacterium]